MVVFTEPTPRFTPGQRWSFKNNAICGICLGQWLPLLTSTGMLTREHDTRENDTHAFGTHGRQELLSMRGPYVSA